jgi:[methyl-Co(III) methanol-specific corrinoid protein]:coenzyme M methyltransferase
MPEVLEAIDLLREKTGGDVPLIVALGTPFELLGTTLSFEDISDALFADPDFVTGELRRMTEIAKRFAREIEKKNPDVLFLADGTPQSLGPRQFAQFSFSYTKDLISSFNRPSILHICGNATSLLEQMAATGADALSIDKPVDIVRALQITNGKVAPIGKISPQTLCFGSREDIIAETEESVKQ